MSAITWASEEADSPAEQPPHLDPERRAQPLEGVQRRVDLARLELLVVPQVEARGVGRRLLRPALLRPQGKLRRFADELPDWTVTAELRSANTVEVRVRPQWLALPEPVREQQARELWQEWARVNRPTPGDKSRLRLVDGSGAKVGGSGALGSMISVE